MNILIVLLNKENYKELKWTLKQTNTKIMI